MPNFEVEMRGDVREVYIVEAESEADAMERWHEGTCVIQETQGVVPISAREER